MLKVDTQTAVLQQLRAAARDSRHGWIRAGFLALNLGVTANAVQQAVHRLRRDGWEITTSDRAAEGGLHYKLADHQVHPADRSLTPARPALQPREDPPQPTDDQTPDNAECLESWPTFPWPTDAAHRGLTLAEAAAADYLTGASDDRPPWWPEEP